MNLDPADAGGPAPGEGGGSGDGAPAVERFEVAEGDRGARLDRFLTSRLVDVSRSKVQAWIAEGRVAIMPPQSDTKPSLALKAGWFVTLVRPEEAPPGLVGEPIPIHVLHEDEDLIIVHKPAGLTVHPGAGRRTGTLVHGLIHRYPGRVWPGSPERPGIVHRLDRQTSGLLAVAASARGYASLLRQIAQRTARRGYIAIVWGAPSAETGTIEAPIGRDPADRRRMAVARRGGRPARSHYRLLRSYGDVSLLEVRLDTGRTHQIRVHMAHVGFPVLGDPIYAGGREFVKRLAPQDRAVWLARLRRLNRQALHAYHLTLEHPRDASRWTFESPLPDDMEHLLLDLVEGEAPLAGRELGG